VQGNAVSHAGVQPIPQTGISDVIPKE